MPLNGILSTLQSSFYKTRFLLFFRSYRLNLDVKLFDKFLKKDLSNIILPIKTFRNQS